MRRRGAQGGCVEREGTGGTPEGGGALEGGALGEEGPGAAEAQAVG